MSIGDVRRWSPAAIDAVVGNLGSRADGLVQMQGELTAAGRLDAWHGYGADAARDRLAELGEDLRRMIAQLSAVTTAARAARDGASAVLASLRETEELAAAHWFVIDDGGWVGDDAPGDHVDPGRDRMLDEIVDRLRSMLRVAADVDSELSTVLDRATHGEIDDGPAATLSCALTTGGAQGVMEGVERPVAGASPAANNAWWDALPEAARSQILGTRPELVGNLDGIPADVRNEANRARLPGEMAAVYAQLEVADPDAPRLSDGTARDRQAVNVLARGTDPASVRLAALQALACLPADRQILLLDTTEPMVRAVVAVGDVDTARNVAVVVPGMTTTVATDIAAKDRAAARLRAESERQGGASTAAVTYLGYDPPGWDDVVDRDGLSDTVLSSQNARAAAPGLTRYLNGIDASRVDDPNLTLLAHSYGSLLAGTALTAGTGVDNAVFYGSPGTGVRDVDELGVPAGRVFVGKAVDDPVAAAGLFGADPADLTGVIRLSTDAGVSPDGVARTGSSGHSQYEDAGTMFSYDAAVVVAGEPQRVVRRP